MTCFTIFVGVGSEKKEVFSAKMIKEETMKGRSPILKRLLQDGIAPGYMHCRNQTNNNFRRKTPTLKNNNNSRGCPDQCKLVIMLSLLFSLNRVVD